MVLGSNLLFRIGSGQAYLLAWGTKKKDMRGWVAGGLVMESQHVSRYRIHAVAVLVCVHRVVSLLVMFYEYIYSTSIASSACLYTFTPRIYFS